MDSPPYSSNTANVYSEKASPSTSQGIINMDLTTTNGESRSVGIATRYGLDGPGIESRWEQDFRHPSRPALGPTQHPIQCVPGISPEVKRQGRSVEHPPPSSAEVEGRVEVYISHSGPSWPVLE